MAKSTKKTYKPAKKGNYKPVVRMAGGGNVSELNYSERREYIEENYAPFITDAQMIFSIWDSGIEYDYKGDRKEVVQSIIDSYKDLADYTESTLPQETIYEIQDWELVRRDIDPDTDEVIGETPLEELSADNTYNFSYNGLVDLNWRVYHDVEYDRFFYVIMPHLGGDIRGNYGDAIILEGNDKDELFYRFYEGFISGGASIYIKFKDGSEIGFDSEQDSDVFSFRLNEVFEPTGMASKYLEDYEKFDSWYGDEFLEETIDIYLARKGVAPKMMAGGSLNDEVPMAYIQILGYDEGKWFNLTDYSDGQDVIDGIYDFMNELNEQFGGNREEFEVTDYEGFGDDLYDEYMGANEFEEIIEAYEKYQSSDFPADVISAYKKDSGSRNDSLSDVIEEMDNNYFGKYDNLNDFGYEMVEQGIYEPSDDDVYITDTDKRLIAGEESDNMVDDMSFDDLLNVAPDTKSEYEDEKSELENKIEELQTEIDDLTALQDSTNDDNEYELIAEQIEEKELELDDVQNELDDIDSRFEDKAREEARESFYDEIYDRLENDLEGWLSDYGYDTGNLADVSFLGVDYEKIGEYLASDYLIVEFDGDMYFFNNYAKGGRITASKRKPKYAYYIVENSTKKLVSGYPTKAEATEQRKLLVQQYPSMRFEIYPLANLEAKTDLDVYAKKDYVELSTLDKIKKVSVDAYRYGQEKVGQANAFLERNDVKGKIKRGARNVWDKTKQGGNWLKRQWQEADFGDGKGKAKFFADGGGVDDYFTMKDGSKMSKVEWYKKMEDKLGFEKFAERILKDSQFGQKINAPSNELTHNRLNKKAVIGKKSVTISSYTPNYNRYFDSKTFDNLKELDDYLNKNQILADGGGVELTRGDIEDKIQGLRLRIAKTKKEVSSYESTNRGKYNKLWQEKVFPLQKELDDLSELWAKSKYADGGGVEWNYWKIEKNDETIYERTNVASPNIPNAKKISKEEYDANVNKEFADGGGASNEHYAIKNENGWVLGYRGSSSEMYFSPHTMPITFPSEKIAQEFIDRNATKNPFIQKGIIVKLFSNGGGVDEELFEALYKKYRDKDYFFTNERIESAVRNWESFVQKGDENAKKYTKQDILNHTENVAKQEAFYTYSSLKQAIENNDKQFLKSRIRYDQKFSKDIFESLTGEKLPSSNSEIAKLIDSKDFRVKQFADGGMAQMGEVSGMLPNPLPMSTIQPMADGGEASEFKKGGNVSSIEKRVAEVNALINEGNEKGIQVVDKTSTWEAPMKYNPIKYTNGVLYVSYKQLDLYKHNKGMGSEWKNESYRIGKNEMGQNSFRGSAQTDALSQIARMYRTAINEFNKYGYANGGQPVQYVPVQAVPQQPVQYVPVQQVQQQPVNSPMGNMDINSALQFIQQNPQVMSMLKNGGVADEISHYDNRINNLEGLVVVMNEEDKPEMYATINKLKQEREHLINKGNNPEEIKPKKSFFGLFAKGGEIKLPKDNSRVHFTDDQNKEFDGKFIEKDEENIDLFLIEGSSDFRYAMEVIDWHYLDGENDDDAHARHEAGETAQEEKAEHEYDVYDNKRMLENQANEIQHHSEELNEQVSKTKKVPAWVISKMERATTDLSDITHYLDGENKMANGGVAGEVKYEILPHLNKFIVAKVTYKQHEDYTYPSKDFIYGFNGKFLEFDDMKSAQNFINNIEPKYPYGVPRANVGMLLLASQLMQQKQQQQQQQQPQVVYYVPQEQTQNTGIVQDIPEMADGGELDYDDELINDFCITNLIELANELQSVKYFVTDRFKETDLESKHYKGRLIIVFKEPASVGVVSAITKFIERAEDCHHIFEQSVNVSGSEPNGLSINLLSDKFGDREFNKGGKVYDYAPKKINISKTKKITTNLGDYNLGLITNDFVYFVNLEEGDDNANTIMYNKKGELLSDNYFANNDLFETLQNESTFEFIHPEVEYNRQEILKGN